MNKKNLLNFINFKIKEAELEIIYGSELNTDWRYGRLDAYKEMLEYFNKIDSDLLQYLTNRKTELELQLKNKFINVEKIKTRIDEIEKIINKLNQL